MSHVLFYGSASVIGFGLGYLLARRGWVIPCPPLDRVIERMEAKGPMGKPKPQPLPTIWKPKM